MLFPLLQGTAVAVGIDVRSRINEWMPYQSRRNIHDFCHDFHHRHHHHFGHGSAPATSSGPSSLALTSLPESTESSSGVEDDESSLPTIHYCYSCNFCRSVFDNLLHFYIPIPLPSIRSPLSSILNIVSGQSAAHIQGGTLPSSQSTSIDSVIDEIPISLDVNANPDSSEAIKPIPAPLRLDELKTLEAIEKKSDAHQATAKPSPSDEEVIPTASENAASSQPSASSEPSSSSKRTSDGCRLAGDQEDIAAVFRMASIEYADQLNNLVAISLMNGDRPDEAMQCWSNCEASARAFFNMGVAYESGRHATDAEPDLARAHDCYALAASMGHRDATYNLALFYLYGKGKIDANVDRAIELLRIAASKGVTSAQQFCGELNKRQLVERTRQKLLPPKRKVTREQLKSRPLRTSIRPSASMFGPCQTRLTPNHHLVSSGRSVPGLRRNNSAPGLLELTTRANPMAVAVAQP